MQCPHCGADTLPGNTFCHRCRKRVAAAPAPTVRLSEPTRRIPPPLPPQARRPAAPAPGSTGRETVILGAPLPGRHKRPLLVTLLAVLDAVGGVLALVLGTVVTLGMVSVAGPTRVVGIGLAVLCAAVAGLSLAAAVGLWRLRPWGRSFSIALAGFSLLGFPLGTLAGALLLVFFLKPGVKILFSGRAPSELGPQERDAIEQAIRSARVLTIVFLGVTVFIVVVMLGTMAAIVIPSLLRARVAANEAATLSQLRTIAAAQEAYRSANGHYDRLDCLVAPGECIPGYPSVAPAFLEQDQALEAGAVAHGYQFEMHLGPPPPRSELNAEHSSPTSVVTYAYTAIPVEPGRSGIRSFCVDVSGDVCSATTRLSASEGGECPYDCQAIAPMP